MKNTLRLVMVSLIVAISSLIFPAMTEAQSVAWPSNYRVEGGATISGSSNLGYENPNLGVYVDGLKTINDRFDLTGNAGWVIRARKTFQGDGQAFTYRLLTRFHLTGERDSRTPVHLVAGVVGATQWTSVSDDSTIGVAAGVGYQFDLVSRGQVTYEFPDFTSNHRVSAIRFDYERMYTPDERVYVAVRPFLSIPRFDHLGTRETGARAGVAIGFGVIR